MAVRIMLLTQWFEPEPAFKGLVFARELIKQGFEVEVVTGFPNYPGGKLYPGYKMRLIQREIVDGVNITRLPLYPSHDGSALKRIVNYVSFGISSAIYGLFKAKRPDVIYAYHPPLTTGITALMLRFFRKVPVMLDIQDMWPQTLAATGMLNNKKLMEFIGKVCNRVYKYSDRIAVNSPGFKRLLIEQGVTAGKIHVIYNWCNEDALHGASGVCPEYFENDNTFRVMFAGNMGQAQGLDAIIEVAEKLQPLRSDISLVLLGSGVAMKGIQSKIAEKKLVNVKCIPSVPMSDVGAYLNAANVLLVHLKDDPLFRITIPSKTQAYMAIGKPVIMAVRGDAADLIREADCGVVAIPEDADSIIGAIIKLADMSETERRTMAEKGKAFYLKRLSLDMGVKQFSEQFRTLSSS